MTDLPDRDALTLSRMIAAREVSAAELMAATLDRIAAANGAINAVVSLCDRDTLMAEAQAADAAPRAGWLHGLPMAIKDLADTAGIATTLGSPLFADHVPEADCGMVARLKSAGAIVIGKTNTPEFGLGSHTVNPVHGATRNPYDPALTAGGSSGGAAAALAARMVAVADGSDMMGSLRNPAAFCNVYGFRPSWGRVPADPVADTYLHRLATEGPMARTVGDLAALLGTMQAADPRWPGPPWPPVGADLDGPVEGLRIGWLGDWGGALPMEEGIIDLVEAGLEVLADLGCHVEHLAPPIPRAALWQSWTTLRSFSVAAKLAPLHADPAKRARLKPAAIWEIERGLTLGAMEVQQASALRSAWLRQAVDLFEIYDVLVLPSAQLFAFDVTLDWPREIAGQAMDSYHRWMEVVVPASLIGLPALGVPVGFDGHGRPMGMQIIGAPGADATVLRLGQAYHRAADWPGRRPPPAGVFPQR